MHDTVRTRRPHRGRLRPEPGRQRRRRDLGSRPGGAGRPAGPGLHAARQGRREGRAHASRGSRHGLDVATFSHELASLLAAGLSVVEALRTLAAKETVGARRALVLEVVQERLRRPAVVGRARAAIGPLSAAADRHRERQRANRRPQHRVAALRRAPAKHQGACATRSSAPRSIRCCCWPWAALVVLFLLGVVVPKFAVLIESTRRELPWTSQLLMTWGRLVASHALGRRRRRAAGACRVGPDRAPRCCAPAPSHAGSKRCR